MDNNNIHDWLFADINENIDMSGDCKGLNQNNICKECMSDAPHEYCCKIECREFEFCKGCESRASLDGIYPCKVNADNQIITEAK